MRLLPLATAAALAGLAVPLTPAAAPTYPWCSRNATTAAECAFDTRAQCEEYLNGIGGSCTQNPGYAGPAADVSSGPYNQYTPRHRRHPDR